jgi:2-polyprenyl-6-methoxyphenol hydroxylase-like FAD-dependent oxidoreductase
MATETIETGCCVVGGGPAGVMLGYLLARGGVPVTLLEKHRDFFRDFRGDTVHPSTLEVMYELGLLEDFLKLPHQELSSVNGVFGDYTFQVASLRRVPTHCKFVALMPQWDFLNFLSSRAQKFSSFTLKMEHEVVDLIDDTGQLSGVRANTPHGPVDIHAGLVIGCDGRHSITRQVAGLEVIESGVPIDVLWFRLPRTTNDPEQLFGNFNYGRALVMIPRGDYFQAALIIPKGSLEAIKERGLDEFRASIVQIAPYIGDRVAELKDWDQVKLLTVQINRLRKWYRPGLLCIGDAAHAMSPAGGVGINLAIQDAVATANLLTRGLLTGQVTEAMLARVQCRREFPTRATQFLQVQAHKGLARVFQNPGPANAPWQLKVAVNVPGVHDLLGRVVGVGVRPEHIAGARARQARDAASLKKVAVGIGLVAAGAMLAFRIFRGVKRLRYA